MIMLEAMDLTMKMRDMHLRHNKDPTTTILIVTHLDALKRDCGHKFKARTTHDQVLPRPSIIILAQVPRVTESETHLLHPHEMEAPNTTFTMGPQPQWIHRTAD